MNTYILILLCHLAFSGTHNTLNNAEFSTKDKCEIAGQLIVKKYGTIHKTCEFICVEK